jgi:hypothetical protein
MRPQAPQLDDSNSKRYQTRPGLPKRAVLCWEPATYTLAWGTQQFDEPHMRVESDAQPYGVELRAFFSTHRTIRDRPDHYVKDAVVRALRVDEDTDIVTIVNGRVEATATIKAGGYIVQNPGGEQYYNTPEELERNYEAL